ncbi:MAG: glycosyltransferase [Flavobacteriales bacterium]|jgi:cellulose synthase/poly-beta-1,6-N-acetylglucosamine synthase-like glycosyltransferase
MTITLILLLLYGLCMMGITVYSVFQFLLAIRWIRYRKTLLHRRTPGIGKWPEVLIQLPLYNEKYVAARIIRACAELDYEKSSLHIQVLDDSTDETSAIVADIVAELSANGHSVSHIRRENREGYKAGALAHGMTLSDAPFIAIFDADFIPPADFLRNTIPWLQNDHSVGVVQTRWGHLNEKSSLLTRIQALALDNHFTVEQGGRNAAGHFINFNGTAGVWRRDTIIDAGGWESDTLTEDLDLSYRAQLRGWKFMFLPQVVVPAELPPDMNALKSQQYRWTKGAAECARKNLKRVLSTPGLGASHTLHAIVHLLNSGVFLCIAGAAILSITLLFLMPASDGLRPVLFISGGLFISTVLFAWVYTISQLGKGKHMYTLIYLYPAFLVMSLGLFLHNAIAVIKGYAGVQTPFIRTPKYAGENTDSAAFRRMPYASRKAAPTAWLEGLAGLVFLSCAAWGIACEDYTFLAFHLMLGIGLLNTMFLSVVHTAR